MTRTRFPVIVTSTIPACANETYLALSSISCCSRCSSARGCTPLTLSAANATQIASAFDKDDPFDVNVSLGYTRTLTRGAIVRELVGRSIDQASPELVKELRYSQVQHVLSLRAEVGVWRDLQLHLEFPIILSRTTSLSLAQNGGDPCGSPASTNCVTPSNSTLVRDGLLDGSQMAPDQVDVAGTGGADGGRVFPERSGLDQIHFGVTWAPLNQMRDPTKPTWLIGFEMRAAVGDAMDYDPQDPDGNTSVGRQVHQYHWWTAVSRSYPYLDVWMGLHYLLPIATSSSLFDRTTFGGSGQERHEPRHVGWLEAGVEVVAWHQEKQNNRLTIELGGKLEGVFEGRGYSPMWQLLARQPTLEGPCLPDRGGGPLTWNNGTYCASANDTIPFPGLTRIENHAKFFGNLAINLELTKYFSARLGVSLGHEQDHYVTFGDAGRALCDPESPGPGCGGILDLDDPKQVNPLYRPLIDAPGRRFRVSETTIFDVFFSAKARF